MAANAPVYSAFVQIDATTQPLWSKIASLGAPLTARMGAMGAAAGAALSAGITAGATAGLAALAGGSLLAGWSVKLASDAEEAASKFSFVFGKASESTGKSLDDFAAAAGRSRFEMRSLAGDIGAILGPMGLGEKATSEMSIGLTTLATDLASFFNATDADALNALRAGIIGESEPLRRFGVTLSEAKVQAQAFAMGLANTKDGITPAIKAQAIYALVMQETKAAQGDAIRTAGSYANAMRALKGSIADAGVEIGRIFLPSATEIVKFMRGWVDQLHAHAATFEQWGQMLGNVTRNVLNDFGILWDLVKSGAALAASTIGKVFVDGLSTMLSALKNASGFLPSWVQSAAGTIIDGVSGVANFIKDAFASITAAFDAMLDHMIDRLTGLGGAGKAAGGAIGSAVLGPAGGVIGGALGGAAGGSPGNALKNQSGAGRVSSAFGSLTPGKIDIREMFSGVGPGLSTLSQSLGQSQVKQVSKLTGLLSKLTGGAPSSPAGGEATGGVTRGSTIFAKLGGMLGTAAISASDAMAAARKASVSAIGKMYTGWESEKPRARNEFVGLDQLNSRVQQVANLKKERRPEEETAKTSRDLLTEVKSRVSTGIESIAKSIKDLKLGFGE